MDRHEFAKCNMETSCLRISMHVSVCLSESFSHRINRNGVRKAAGCNIRLQDDFDLPFFHLSALIYHVQKEMTENFACVLHCSVFPRIMAWLEEKKSRWRSALEGLTRCAHFARLTKRPYKIRSKKRQKNSLRFSLILVLIEFFKKKISISSDLTS